MAETEGLLDLALADCGGMITRLSGQQRFEWSQGPGIPQLTEGPDSAISILEHDIL
jgi:hypothetical protein